MGGNEGRADEYDLFLSYASPDRDWVVSLADRLEALGLRVFIDQREIAAADNFVLRLSDGLAQSRYLVLVLSSNTEGRDWITQEWTAFMAAHGPMGRLLPVMLDAVDLPAILTPTQATDATHRDAVRAADDLFAMVGDASKLSEGDVRRLVFGQVLVFTLSRADEHLRVVRPDGSTREVPLPWTTDKGFAVAHLEFEKLHRQPMTNANDHADLYRHARALKPVSKPPE